MRGGAKGENYFVFLIRGKVTAALSGRSLRFRLLCNRLQCIVLTVIWRVFQR